MKPPYVALVALFVPGCLFFQCSDPNIISTLSWQQVGVYPKVPPEGLDGYTGWHGKMRNGDWFHNPGLDARWGDDYRLDVIGWNPTGFIPNESYQGIVYESIGRTSHVRNNMPDTSGQDDLARWFDEFMVSILCAEEGDLAALRPEFLATDAVEIPQPRCASDLLDRLDPRQARWVGDNQFRWVWSHWWFQFTIGIKTLTKTPGEGGAKEDKLWVDAEGRARFEARATDRVPEETLRAKRDALVRTFDHEPPPAGSVAYSEWPCFA